MICSRGLFDFDNANKKLAELEESAQNPRIWDNQRTAQALLKEKSKLEKQLSFVKDLSDKFQENLDLIEVAVSEGDKEILDVVEEDLKNLAVEAAKSETECLFSGDADDNNCFLDINSGAGGTESDDWASIMLRMYLMFAKNLNFKTEIINMIEGEEAGIKSCTVKIIGYQAYGWFKTETGVHRLVRISPYNAAGKRMTSFASAWIYPEVDDSINITIDEKDLRIDTYRSSGAGGQHVNTTDSAVRITHLPTNIAVACQSGRSQHKNKAEAMTMLKARLYDRELKIREAEANQENATKTDIGWGHQIRSYVLQPYQMVKDLRTGFETSDTQGVLDGKLTGFVSASLARKIGR